MSGFSYLSLLQGESDASFDNQSKSEVKQTQRKQELRLDTQLKITVK